MKIKENIENITAKIQEYARKNRALINSIEYSTDNNQVVIIFNSEYIGFSNLRDICSLPEEWDLTMIIHYNRFIKKIEAVIDLDSRILKTK